MVTGTGQCILKAITKKRGREGRKEERRIKVEKHNIYSTVRNSNNTENTGKITQDPMT